MTDDETIHKQHQIKQILYDTCKADIAKRLETIQSSLSSIAESKSGDTKSSAGDKFETSVAMMHLEEDKLKRQLHEANLVFETLHGIDIARVAKTARLGSLVTTNKGEYFLAIGLGKVTVKDKVYYCVSMTSPIGAQLVGKAVNDVIVFNGLAIIIEAIC